MGTHLRDLELENTDINFCNLTIHKMFKEQYGNLQSDMTFQNFALGSKHVAKQNIQLISEMNMMQFPKNTEKNHKLM